MSDRRRDEYVLRLLSPSDPLLLAQDLNLKLKIRLFSLQHLALGLDASQTIND